jgi:hypothetical protein
MVSLADPQAQFAIKYSKWLLSCQKVDVHLGYADHEGRLVPYGHGRISGLNGHGSFCDAAFKTCGSLPAKSCGQETIFYGIGFW